MDNVLFGKKIDLEDLEDWMWYVSQVDDDKRNE
jgi:hypothetical protein